MSNKSIDGLQRRNTGGRGKTSGSSRATTSTVMKRRKTAKKPTTKQLGINDSQAELKALIAEGEKLERLNKNEKEKIIESTVDDDNQEAVKEFLSEVKDVDPTDLIEVPKEEKTKGWFKKSKKKANKTGKKKGHKKWIIIGVILALLIGGGAWLYFYLNDFVNQVTDGGNIVNVLFSDPDTPLEKDATRIWH